MSLITVLINILALIGLIIIIIYAIRYLYLYVRKKETQKIANNINPPGSYMQNSGIKCPDYWVNSGIDSNGNYLCNNLFNIPINDNAITSGKCNSKEMIFSPVEKGYTWEYGNPNQYTSYTDEQKYDFVNEKAVPDGLTRCQWINNCGPTTNVQGIWSGVQDICNHPKNHLKNHS